MIPNKNIHNQQSPDGMNYTLTQLTTIKYPIDTDGNSRFVRGVGFNEWDIVIKEDRFEMKKTPYGSRELPIHFAFSNESDHQIVSRAETIRFNGRHHKLQKCTGMNQKRNSEVQKATIRAKRKPIQSPIDSSSTPPQHSPPMSVERVIEMLSKPIPFEIHVDPLKITKDIRDWMTSNSCSQGFFASNILNVCRSRFNYLLNYPALYGILKSGKEYFVKMYNSLGMSKDERNQIMSMDLYGTRSIGKVNKAVQVSENSENFVDIDEPPKKISRKRPASVRSDTSSESSSSPSSPTAFTHQMITELLNKPVDFVDTKRVSAEIKEWLVESQATQEWFASTIVGRNRRTMGPAINYPRDWNDCASKGQETFMRMHNWMKLSEMQRQQIMRQHKLKNIIPIRNNQQSPDGMNYTLTQLTTIKYPIDTDGNSRFVRGVGFNEWDIVIKEDRFEMKKTPYGSRELPIHFAFSNEREHQIVSDIETIRFDGLHHKPQKCTGMMQKRSLKGKRYSRLDRFNYLLNYPGLYGTLKSGKEYFVKMYNWLGMLKDERNQIMAMDLYGIRSAGKVNKAVQVSKDMKIFVDIDEPPKKISRKRPASLRSDTSSESSSSPPSPPAFTHQMVTEILNKPVDFVDTKRVSAEIKEWLVESQATQEWFASTIVGRNRRTMGPAINYPRDWNDCASKGQEMFMRMHNWMKLSEMQRQEIMRQYKLKSAKCPKTTIPSMKSSERNLRNAASDMIIYSNC
ncbi:hypothetical protein GCK72_012751 [Caenorhabditis remanei]|uniref:CUT domain-containing protein n=1 Tax=Caenorhabditis remanei TaxID=31234 RepID=A0A6A5GLU0_CAERE|nr:hypothetical protein GCK72_012751 [Caenorhabditis remanei]KAF1756298.1 hypothetical protein GCK72_012751 [Caenorhabditis remanei]